MSLRARKLDGYAAYPRAQQATSNGGGRRYERQCVPDQICLVHPSGTTKHMLCKTDFQDVAFLDGSRRCQITEMTTREPVI